MALSDGTFLDLLIERLNVLARRAKSVQRAVACDQRGSRRNAVATAKVARIQAMAARVRLHWQHVATSAVARDFSTVVVENLAVQAMTASARGTVEEPGSNIRQKAGLTRAILANGWAGSVTMLAYKLPARGGEVMKEWAAQSSQTGRVDICDAYCVTCDRDGIGARNILDAGHTV